jgi:hypothetical protein
VNRRNSSKAAPASQPPLCGRPEINHAHDFPIGPQEPPLILPFHRGAGFIYMITLLAVHIYLVNIRMIAEGVERRRLVDLRGKKLDTEKP